MFNRRLCAGSCWQLNNSPLRVNHCMSNVEICFSQLMSVSDAYDQSTLTGAALAGALM